MGGCGQRGVRWRTLVLAAVVGWTPACLETPHVLCADGRTCPEGTVCDDLHQRCVNPAQLTECAGSDEGDRCDIAGAPVGVCKDGVCLREGCGDFIVSGLEQCDGTTFPEGIEDCRDLGYDQAGALGCLRDCRFDTSACTGICLDGTVDADEDCEPTDLGGVTCLDFGFYTEAGLACTNVCTFDVSGCRDWCGDGIVNGGEECDDTDLAGATCQDLGFYDAPGLACNSRCQFDDSACAGYCGDGEVRSSAGEVCDGAPPAAGSCIDFGFDLGHLGCSPFCTPGFDDCAQNGWTALPAPPPAWYRGIYSDDGVELFLVGQQPGVAARFDGNQWSEMATPTSDWLFGLWGSSRSNLYASGDNGLILHYDGTSWTEQDSKVFPAMFGIWGSGPNDIFAVGAMSTITHYDGTGWTPQSVPGNATLQGVWGSGPGDVYAVGSGGEILRYNGTAWTQETSNTTQNLHAVFAWGPNLVLAAGVNGVLMRRGRSGWRREPVPTTTWLSALSGSGPSDLYAGGGNGVVLRFDGHSWEPLETDSANWFDDFWSGGDAGNLIGVGEGGLVRRFTGRTWHAPISAIGTNANAVWAELYPHIFVVGSSGLVMRHSPNQHWAISNTPGFGALNGVWGTAPDNVFAVGATLQHWNGISWTEMTSPVNEPLNDIWGLGPNDIYAVGGGGRVIHFSGTQWQLVNAGAATRLDAVHGSGPDDLWIVGFGGAIYRDDGTGWSPHSSPTALDLYAVHSVAPDDVYIGGSGGVFHWDGAQWVDLGAPAGNTIRELWWSGPGDLFAVGGGGALLHYDGQGWMAIDSESTLTLHGISGTPGHLIMVGDNSRVSHLARLTPWGCAAAEHSCGDARDDDCDGLIDVGDPDCAAGVRLSEIRGAVGGGTRYLEVTNRSGSHANLAGLVLDYESACDGAIQSVQLSSAAVLPAGASFRAVDDPGDVGQRESGLWSDWCHRPDDSAWVALCDGPCDRDFCTNLIDYVELAGAGTVTGLPCATITPGPVDVSGAGNNDSAGRAAYAGYADAGVTSDWTVGAATRN